MATPRFNYMSTEPRLMQSSEVLLPVIDYLDLIDNKDYTRGYNGDGSIRDWIRENFVKDLDIQLRAFGSELI